MEAHPPLSWEHGETENPQGMISNKLLIKFFGQKHLKTIFYKVDLEISNNPKI